MEIVIQPTPAEVDSTVADIVEGYVRAGATTLGLATGSSPIGTYRELAARHRDAELDFSLARAFLLDEYLGLPKRHPQSYYSVIRSEFVDHVNLDPAMVSSPNGEAPCPEQEIARYDQSIAAAGGVDVQLLGIGTDGHIGFNEPCDHFPVITHEVQLTEMTREANKRFFDSLDDVPTAAITMGVGTVMAARKTLLIATGADKADILYKVFFGPVTPEVPGSILQFHSDVTLICDEAAAAKMPQEGQQCSI